MIRSKQYQDVARHLLIGALVSMVLLCGAALSAAEPKNQDSQAHPHSTVHGEPGKIASESPAQWATVVPEAAASSAHAKPLFIDLSHTLHDGTLHWPQNSGFRYKVDLDTVRTKPDPNNASQTIEDYYLKSDSFTMAVHTGTHLDAPRHFSKTGWTVEQIPLERLIDVPVTVIDLSEKVKANRSYLFAKEDLLDKRTRASLVQPNSVVLIYTGVSSQYDQGEKAYYGGDTKNLSDMKIPGFGQEAAQFLVEQRVFGVGLDAPSADSSERHTKSGGLEPKAHIAFNTNNLYILENVSGKLRELIGKANARLTIAPLPIVNGSGSPVRLVAMVGHECHEPLSNGAQSLWTQYGDSQMLVLIWIAALTYFVSVRTSADISKA